MRGFVWVRFFIRRCLNYGFTGIRDLFIPKTAKQLLHLTAPSVNWQSRRRNSLNLLPYFLVRLHTFSWAPSIWRFTAENKNCFTAGHQFSPFDLWVQNPRHLLRSNTDVTMDAKRVFRYENVPLFPFSIESKLLSIPQTVLLYVQDFTGALFTTRYPLSDVWEGVGFPCEWKLRLAVIS